MRATIKIELEFETAEEAARLVRTLPGVPQSTPMTEAQAFALNYQERTKQAEEEAQRMFEEIQALTNAKRAKKRTTT